MINISMEVFNVVAPNDHHLIKSSFFGQHITNDLLKVFFFWSLLVTNIS